MSRNERGVTLIEIVIVLALVVIVGKAALLVSFDSYRDSSFRTDRMALVTALEHARAESIGGVCEAAPCTDAQPHGVMIGSSTYIVFEGPDYASRDQDADVSIEANPATLRSGLMEIVFATSSGDVAHPGTIILTDTASRTSTITVGDEGQISWSN